jgi:hypothetical protein
VGVHAGMVRATVDAVHRAPAEVSFADHEGTRR